MPTHQHTHEHDTARLPRDQALVLDRLRRAGSPKTAYELLDELRDEGFRAPLTVYRALEGLRRNGLVHRIESLKAFVACCEDEHAARPALAVCGDCGAVAELEEPDLPRLIDRIAGRAASPSDSMIELRGTCAACVDAGKRKAMR